MINDKIGKLISELKDIRDLLFESPIPSQKVDIAGDKVNHVISGLGDLIGDIEAEKAIDGCRVKILEMCDDGLDDCGISDGKCNGYSNDDGMLFEECRTCEYNVNYEEE